jgi:LmbE family N-acetylglucosaminyl deacetylase
VNDLLPMPTDWERALAVVAHPDDIEFGSAAAIAAWTAAGRTVTYLLLTRGEAGIDGMPPERAARERTAEQLASAAIVGVKDVEFLNYRDGSVEYGLPLRRSIAAAIRRHRPDLVVTYNHRKRTWISGKWNTPDHRNAGLAALDAIGDAGNRWIFPELTGEPWGGVRYVAVAASARPTHAVDVTDSIDLGVSSLEAHASYLKGLGVSDVRAPIAGFAQQTGQRFGGRPAVPFELLRY